MRLVDPGWVENRKAYIAFEMCLHERKLSRVKSACRVSPLSQASQLFSFNRSDGVNSVQSTSKRHVFHCGSAFFLLTTFFLSIILPSNFNGLYHFLFILCLKNARRAV